MLPEVRSSSEEYGVTTLPVIAGVQSQGYWDTERRWSGRLVFNAGELNTYGTGAFLLDEYGERMVVDGGLLTTVAYKLAIKELLRDWRERGHYWRTGAMATRQPWDDRDEFGVESWRGRWKTMAMSIRAAFSGLYAPYERECAGRDRGAHAVRKQGHLARAVLEATAFQTREVWSDGEDARISLASLRVDGGMVVNELLMQFQAIF